MEEGESHGEKPNEDERDKNLRLNSDKSRRSNPDKSRRSDPDKSRRFDPDKSRRSDPTLDPLRAYAFNHDRRSISNDRHSTSNEPPINELVRDHVLEFMRTLEKERPFMGNACLTMDGTLR